MRGNSLVETDIKGGRIDKGDPCANAEACFVANKHIRDQSRRNIIHKTGIADQAGKLVTQMHRTYSV